MTRRAPVDWVPGTPCRLYIDFTRGGGPADFPAGEEPCEGDLLRTPAGASYYIVEARQSKTRRGRWHFKCERLPYGSVDPAGEGVWVFGYNRRR